MTFAFWQVVANTPWWNYCFFIYLFMLAQNAKQPRIVPLHFLSIIPISLVLLSCTMLLTVVKFTPLLLSHWISGCMAGSVLGALQFYLMGIKGVKNQRAVYVPGTYTLYALTLAILIGDYYLRFKHLSSSDFLNTENTALLVIIYGTFNGFFIGRMLLAFWRVQFGPFVNASQPSH